VKTLTPDQLRALTPTVVADELLRARTEGGEFPVTDPVLFRTGIAIAGHLDRIATALERLLESELEAAEAAKAAPTIGPGTLSMRDLAGR
jgi:hypothetical protein